MKKKSVYYSLVAFSLVAALIIGTLLAATVISSSTADDIALYGYKLGTGYTVVLVMIAVCLVAFAACTFVLKENFKKSFNNNSPSASYAKMLVALAVIAYIIYSFVNPDNTVKAGNSVWYTVLKVLSALSALYLLASALFAEKIKKDVLAVASLLPVIALVAKVILDYLIQNVGIHGDLYHYHLLSLCAFVLFAVNESRFLIDKGIPSLYVFFGMTSAVFTMVYALTNLALVIKGYRTWDMNAVYCLVDLALVAYVYIRLYNVEWRNKQEVTAAVGVVAFSQEEHEAAVNEELYEENAEKTEEISVEANEDEKNS